MTGSWFPAFVAFAAFDGLLLLAIVVVRTRRALRAAAATRRRRWLGARLAAAVRGTRLPRQARFWRTVAVILEQEPDWRALVASPEAARTCQPLLRSGLAQAAGWQHLRGRATLWSRLFLRGWRQSVPSVLEGLARVADAGQIPLFLAFATAPDPPLATGALLAIGRHPDPFAGAAVAIAGRARESSGFARMLAVWALRQLMTAHPFLIESMIADPAADVRVAAVHVAVEQAGAQKGGPAPGPGVAAALVRAAGDPDPRVRRVACDGLAMLGDPETGAALQRLVFDRVYNVRMAAAQALGSRRDPQPIGVLLDAIRTGEPALRRAVVESAVAMPGIDVRVIARYTRNEDRAVRVAAVRLLGALARPESCAVLCELVASPEAEIRRYAALSAGTLFRRGYPQPGPADLVTALTGRLAVETDVRVISALVEALEFSSDRRAADTLVAYVPSCQLPVRERVLEAMALMAQLATRAARAAARPAAPAPPARA